MHSTKRAMKIAFVPLILFFILFLVAPMLMTIWQSLYTDRVFSISPYLEAFTSSEIMMAMWNSLKVSSVSALVTTGIAFFLAYSIEMTNVGKPVKKFIQFGITLPMFLPTITYGFVLIYVFGNQGLLTKLIGKPLFAIYGFNGLLVGYILYTLPAAFILIQNAFYYVDKRFLLVSDLMGDRFIRKFYHTIFRPMLGAIGGAFVLTFVLSFTDFGIPASIGGTYEVIATTLYQTMLGSIPNFQQGAVISVLMLIPAIVSVVLLGALEKLNFQQTTISTTELTMNRWRDVTFGTVASIVAIVVLGIFAIMFVAPFTVAYPFNLTFTLDFLKRFIQMDELTTVYWHSIFVALFTAIVGVVVAFTSALLSARTTVKGHRSFDFIAMMTNTIPGMVLGLSYLFLFNNSSLKGTFMIIIICNIIHFFTTPYLMAKNALQKMDSNWEVIGELLHDSWFQTVYRVIIPNVKSTILEMFSYFFINAMVTVSGIIFLVSTETLLVSAKIKELQHFNKFNDIFILSIFILATNVLIKLICEFWLYKQKKKENAK